MKISRRRFMESLAATTGAAALAGCGGDNGAELSRVNTHQAFRRLGGGGEKWTPAQSNSWTPAYAKLEDEGKFAERIEEAESVLESCRLCPRECGVNRLNGERGFCEAPAEPVVFNHNPHYGEENPLVGRGGSGTIFFSHCNLRCVFCQNWPIAHEGEGRTNSHEELADRMIDLQNRGCHNINVVTPTHQMPAILRATRIALDKGLRLPLCYNTGGYEREEIVRLLDGIVDIYLPDIKYMDGEEANRYSTRGAPDYPERAQEAVAEMHRQVGDLVTDDNGIALRGVMVRHLVMPNRIAGTREFVHWVAENLSTSTYVNIMSQYRVEHRAFEYERIARSIRPEEFLEAMEWAEEAGLTNLDERSVQQRDLFRRRLG